MIQRESYNLVCRSCDLVIKVPPYQKGVRCICPRCKGHLRSGNKVSLQNLAIVSIASIIMLFTSLTLPFMTISSFGISQTMSLSSISQILYHDWSILLFLCLFFTFLCPLIMHIIIIGIVFFRLRVTRRVAKIYAFCHTFSMVDVFIVGVLVSLIKLVALATVEFHEGFYCTIIFALLMVWCYSKGSPYRIWNLKQRCDNSLASATLGKRAIEQGILMCRHCGFSYWRKSTLSNQLIGNDSTNSSNSSNTSNSSNQKFIQDNKDSLKNSETCSWQNQSCLSINKTTPNRARSDFLQNIYQGAEPCPRCGHHNDNRAKFCYQKTIALLCAALVLYIPSNLYPIMVTEYLGAKIGSNIIDGVISLWNMHSYFVAIVILIASIFIPVLKILCILFLLWITHRGIRLYPSKLNKLYRIVLFIGRWSMIDVFVVIIMSTIVRMSGLLTISPGIAVVCFSFVVLITMFAAEEFDERLLWDSFHLYSVTKQCNTFFQQKNAVIRHKENTSSLKNNNCSSSSSSNCNSSNENHFTKKKAQKIMS